MIGRAGLSEQGVWQANPPGNSPRREWERNYGGAKQLTPNCREKPLVRALVSVPQTDTGRRGENPKARERTLVKELGKMTP